MSSTLLRSLLTLLLLAGCASDGIYHTVRPGESLAGIARTYGRNEVGLARINGIAEPSALHSGDRLFIPGARAPRQVTPPSSTATAKPSTVRQTPFKPKAVSKPPPLVPTSAAKKSPAPPLKPEPGRFQWPVRGELLRRFGDPKPFPCKGVEIAAPLGSPILAAAAGRVIYSGDGIRSFGNMVILKHDNDYFTVYAFNQRNLIESGSFVSKGERIALSGAPPEKARPRLYFEIRRHKEPVDPTFYLP